MLHEGKYAEAIELYGGDYDTLAAWFPDVDPNDHARLLEQGCTLGGLQRLPVKEIIHREPTAFEFTVQFENPDGSLFVRGPCCGEVEENTPPQSEFEYTVMNTKHGFVVQELPVYVP